MEISQGSVSDEQMDNERVQRQSLSLEDYSRSSGKSVKTGLLEAKTKSGLGLTVLLLPPYTSGKTSRTNEGKAPTSEAKLLPD
jgi:hypothetical protein